MKKQYDPLKVEKTDHPDLVGGVVWADCELDWIRAYGTRCYNHGNAKGMEAGRLLFEEPKVGAGDTAVVKDMWLAAWTIAAGVNREDERENCAKLCDEWARICDSGKRHGAKVGAQECAKLIRTQDDAEHA